MSGGKLAGEVTAGSMKGSSPLRWLPLALLAMYAALDCLLQYTLAATDATALLHIPPGVVNFIRVTPLPLLVCLLIRGIVYWPIAVTWPEQMHVCPLKSCPA